VVLLDAVPVATLTVGSTTTSPTLTPVRTWVVELPTRPTTTVRFVCVLPWRTDTVEVVPVVVTAALGSSITLDFDVVMTLTFAVIPVLTFEGGLASEIVTL
jgi:hypothetical protein